MKRKLFVITIILAMIFAFTACGGSGSEESADSQDGGKSEKVEGSLISCDDGELKFIEVQKADPKLTDAENAYIFVFEYTNYMDDPSECQNTFWIQYFQNNSELTNSTGWRSEAQEQYDLVNAQFNTALKDGTVRFGQIVTPKDNSPVTVMAKEMQNQDHYETIEVDISDETVSGDNGDENDSSVDIESMLQGDWVLQDENDHFFRFEKPLIVSLVDSESGNIVGAGTYTINQDSSSIDCVIKASDNDVKFNLPYKIEDGVLHLYNNQNKELLHK